jgi:hypothetical protein
VSVGVFGGQEQIRGLVVDAAVDVHAAPVAVLVVWQHPEVVHVVRLTETRRIRDIPEWLVAREQPLSQQPVPGPGIGVCPIGDDHSEDVEYDWISWKVCRNFTVLVPVSATVSVLMVLNLLVVPAASGAVSAGTAALSSAWPRYRQAVVSGLTHAAERQARARSRMARRSFRSWAMTSAEDCSGACGGKVLRPFVAFRSDVSTPAHVVRWVDNGVGGANSDSMR